MTTLSRSLFTDHSAAARLQQLAHHPFDLTKPGNLTSERLEKYVAEACGYRFLYGLERINDEVMEALALLAREARVLDKMSQMQSGEVINRIEGHPSDNRRVLHTAMRDFFDSQNPSPIVREATEKAQREHNKLRNFLQKIDQEGRFRKMITVAIGGSDLGPRCLHVALQNLRLNDREVFFVSNVDPDDVARVLRRVSLEETLVLVVSKSGTTLETVTNEEILRTRFRERGLCPEEHFLCVTEEGGPMDLPERYAMRFYLWDYVGGRFSGTSMGGAVSLAFAYGYPVLEELLRGAHEMDLIALSDSLTENIPLLGALLSVWNHNFLKYPTLAFVPYSEALSRFSAHIQQVSMESNGKHIDRFGRPVHFETGPIVWGEPGNNAQHSFYQLIHQGTSIVPVEFVGFKESQYGEDLVIQGTTSQQKLLANLFAQGLALATGQKSSNPNRVFPGNRPSHILLGKKLTPYALGALFAYVEHKVAFEGFLWDINSFDQEGVELGKVLANQVMGIFSGQKLDFPLGKSLVKQLDRLE